MKSGIDDHPSEFRRTIENFDGHTWEIFYMDMTKNSGGIIIYHAMKTKKKRRT